MLQTYELQCNQGIGKSRNFCFCPIPSIPDLTQPYGFPTGTVGIPYNSHSHCRKCKLVPFPTLIGSGREWEWELRVGNDTLVLCCGDGAGLSVAGGVAQEPPSVLSVLETGSRYSTKDGLLYRDDLRRSPC